MDSNTTSPSGTPEPERTTRFAQRRFSGTNKIKDSNSDNGETNSVRCNGTRTLKDGTKAKDRWGKLKTTMTSPNTNTPRKKAGRLDRGDSFLRKFSTRNQAEVKEDQKSQDDDSKTIQSHKTRHRNYVINPYGGLMFHWLGVVTLAVMYNLWTCIAREAFREIQEGYMAIWFCTDGVCDFIYVCDIFVQLRTGYLQQGLMVYDSSKLCLKYLKDRCFIVDLGCLLPLDFLQFYVGIHPMLRFPRFLKVYRSLRFMQTYESRTAYPNLLRVANLSHILFLGSHWFAAFYYLISEAEGFDGDWSYPKPENQFASVTRKYLASMYWSTLTLTTIGDLPPPDTNWQYVFVIVSYLIGVFIFATIVGQVGNVITNRNASRQEFERLLDGAKFYMQMHNVPPELQRRVQRWYDYVWTRGRLNCNDINSLGLLPDKLKTELALHVNLGTLKKVTIFQKCRPEFLHDLMLKMRAYIFTPGDLICRRGEVAREMFIIADGVVEILGENATVLTQMSTGDFFGEIGILNLDGGINRRTADVRSVGYSELFVLSREDVLAALKDHPDAEQIIREFGQRRLKETEEHRKMARSTPNSPEPGSAWKSGRQSRRTKKAEQNRLNLPHVKCLQKIPHMSPKLKKMFHRKPNSTESQDTSKHAVNGKQNDLFTSCSRKEDNCSDNSDTKSKFRTENELLPLEIIQERDGSCDNNDQSDTEVSGGGGDGKGLTLASVVLNLLKNKRQVEYSAVNTSGDDTDDEFTSIKVDNIGDIVNGVGVSGKTKLPPKESEYNAEHDSDKNSFVSRNSGSWKPVTSSDNSDDTCSVRDTAPPHLPKIVLTTPTNISTSDSSDSSEVADGHLPTPHPVRKSYLSRKSSPSISPLSPELSERIHRRISLPPPLGLPDIARLRQQSSSHSDMSTLLESFKSSIENRLDAIEITYKDSIKRVDKYIALQEKLMDHFLKSPSQPAAVSSDAGTDKDPTCSTDTNIPRVQTTAHSQNDDVNQNQHQTVIRSSSQNADRSANVATEVHGSLEPSVFIDLDSETDPNNSDVTRRKSRDEPNRRSSDGQTTNEAINFTHL